MEHYTSLATMHNYYVNMWKLRNKIQFLNITLYRINIKFDYYKLR